MIVPFLQSAFVQGLVVLAGFWLCLLSVAWARQLRTKNATSLDVYWSFGVASSGLYWVLWFGNFSLRSWIIAGLLLFWGFRLGLFLWVKRVRGGKSEDSRYAKYRAQWGRQANVKFLWFYLFQAFLIPIFSIPVFVAIQAGGDQLSTLDGVAISIWMSAIVGESVSDFQLSRYLATRTSSDSVFQGGLWGYSRHPNYFFEWLHWWAYVVFSWNSSYWAVSLLGPFLMGIFLFYVTGIPIIERQALEKKGEAYRDYQRRVSAFIPWFPKPKA